VFEEEKPRLLRLAAHRFDTDLMRVVRSDKTIYVRFDQNDYSIPPEAIGRALTLVASPNNVHILDGSSEIARHRRSYDRLARIEDPNHIEALLKQKQRAIGSAPGTRLERAVPEIRQLLDAAFNRGESITRQKNFSFHLPNPLVAAELALGRKKLPDLRRGRRLDLQQPLVDGYLPSMVHLVGDVKITKCRASTSASRTAPFL
jgi:hypothetical protein